MSKTKLTLADLKRGETATVVAIEANGVTRQRLLDFGFRPGEVIKVIRLAPLADPIALTIRGGHISLRRSGAALVTVEKTS